MWKGVCTPFCLHSADFPAYRTFLNKEKSHKQVLLWLLCLTAHPQRTSCIITDSSPFVNTKFEIFQIFQCAEKYSVSRTNRKYNRSRSYIYFWRAHWDGSGLPVLPPSQPSKPAHRGGAEADPGYVAEESRTWPVRALVSLKRVRLHPSAGKPIPCHA